MFSEHGGDIFSYEIKYDFSVNLNPLGMPEGVKRAVISAIGSYETYPDPLCRALTGRLAEMEKTVPEKIVCGNGAADLIYRIVSAIRPGTAAVAAPSFGEYEKAARQSGCEIRKFYLREEDDFALSGYFCDFLDGGADLVFLCSPNNPTGRLVPLELLQKIARKCEKKGIIMVCDECFLPFAENPEQSDAKRFLYPNMILLKAFTKIFSMAGIRLGYSLFGDEKLAEAVRKTSQFWSVSAPAQTAGIAALSETEYLVQTARLIRSEREYLSAALGGLGLKVYCSDANFLLFFCDKPLGEMLLRSQFFII